jgi:hypothetical protein
VGHLIKAQLGQQTFMVMLEEPLTQYKVLELGAAAAVAQVLLDKQ